MNTASDIPVTESSGNVFADLDLPEPEEALAKAELAYAIGQIISRKRLSQSQAALLLGIDQPKVSALMRGRLSGFSIERLLRFIRLLNQDIEIIIRPGKQATARGQVRVTTTAHPEPVQN